MHCFIYCKSNFIAQKYSFFMSQYRYNKKPRAIINQSIPHHKELLHSTQLNLNRYELSKHQIYQQRNHPHQRFNKSLLHKMSTDPINNSLNQFKLPIKFGSTNLTAHSQPFYSAKPKKKSLHSEEVIRNNIREVLLIDQRGGNMQDRFPQICAKRFNLQKVERVFRRVQRMNSGEERIVKGGFEPWQIDDQWNDLLNI